MGYFDTVKHVIEKADVILLIIDSRMPDLAMNKELDLLVAKKGKGLIYVFNKIDLLSFEDLNELKDKFSGAFFVSTTKKIGVEELTSGIYRLAHKRGIDLPHVGIVGYPNVGKSAIINAMAGRAKTNVSSVAGTTKGIQWIRAGKLRIIDSPGVITYEENEERLGFIGAKNPEQMKNPESVACEIIDHCIKKNKKAFEEFYGIKVETEDKYQVMLQVGSKRKFLLKKGEIDEKRTAIHIIRDWQKGILKI